MSSDYDASEFIDADLQGQKALAPAGAAALRRAPTREEVDSKVLEAQQKLAELKREQEALERERAGLEETRRRQMEFQTGRQEMVQHLTRGLGLLEEAEFAARRDAEQMTKTVGDLRDSLGKLQAIREETWTGEAFNVELTRALTVVENSRMEWNAARLKFPVLAGTTQAEAAAAAAENQKTASLLERYTFGDLCRIGFALTWPLALVAFLGLVTLLVFLLLAVEEQRMGWFSSKPDPLSNRARAQNSEIAELEARIKRLDAQIQRGQSKPNSLSATGPGAAPGASAPRSASATPASSPAGEPIFEEVDLKRLNAEGEAATTAAHYNELGMRKYDLPALLGRIRKHFRGPATTNPKLVSYLAAGGIQGLRPLRYEKRVARNRFIVLVAALFIVLLGLILTFVRHSR